MSGATYKTYRRVASKLNPLYLFFIIVLFSVPYNAVASLSLEVKSRPGRLQGPQGSLIRVDQQRSGSLDRGPGCQSAEVQTFQLSLKDLELTDFIEIEKFQKARLDPEKKVGHKFAPCHVFLESHGSKKWTLHLSYVLSPQANEWKSVTYEQAGSWLFDVWPVKASAKSSSAFLRRQSAESSSGDASRSPAGLGARGELIIKEGDLSSSFGLQEAWEALLKSENFSFELSSPELNRFRFSAESTINISDSGKEYYRQGLVVPFFPLRGMNIDLDFEERPLPKARVLDVSDSNLNRSKAVTKALGYILSLTEQKDYLAALKALEVLESSRHSASPALKSTSYFALKGHLLIKVGREIGEEPIILKGVETWRDAIQDSGPTHSEERVYIAMELAREFSQSSNAYMALAFLTWASEQKWPVGTEERFEYLRAYALMRLGMLDQAAEGFSRIRDRASQQSIRSFQDRRLVPRAALWIGDMHLAQSEYTLALEQYNEAFRVLGASRSFPFENTLYPELVKSYPEALFNRAMAFLGDKKHQEALRDLRAYISIRPSDPHQSLVLFRIAEIMQKIGAPQNNVNDIWRECVFRAPESLGAKLCAAHQARTEMIGSDRDALSRHIGTIDELSDYELKVSEIKKLYPVPKNDQNVYAVLLVADGFFRRGETDLALKRLDTALRWESTPELNLWANEYRVSALSAEMDKLNRAGQHRRVVEKYEYRRRQALYRLVRPEVIWQVSVALKALGLNDKAFELSGTGLSIHESMSPYVTRGVNVEEFHWLGLQSELALRLLEEEKIDPKEVNRKLNAFHNVYKKSPLVADSDFQIDKMWARYHRSQGEVRREIASLNKGIDAGLSNYDGVRRLSDIYESQGDERSKNQLLINTVGKWFNANKDMSEYPGPELLYRYAMVLRSTNQMKESLNTLKWMSSLEEGHLNIAVSRAMLIYKKGSIEKDLGLLADARQSFEAVRELDANSIWSSLASDAVKEIPAQESF